MLPTTLFKAFPCEEYARNYVNGKIRFSTLSYYKNIEDDDRSDRTEGSGQLCRDGEELVVDLTNKVIHSRPGVENLHVAAEGNDHFICCFSSPKDGCIESLPTKFGEYYVIVHNPAELFSDIESAINCDSSLEQNVPCLEASAIRYDKGKYVGSLHDRAEIQKLAWMQKPESHSEEQEFRFQFQFCFSEFIGSPEHYILELGKILEYCEIVKRKS